VTKKWRVSVFRWEKGIVKMGIKAMALDKNKFGPLILITGELTHSFLCCIMRGLLKLISLIDIVN